MERFIKHINIKENIKVWMIFTFLVFVLYDVVWLLVGVNEIDNFAAEDIARSFGIDLLYCAIFSATGCIVSNCILAFGIRKNKKLHAIAILLILFTVNMAVAYAVESAFDAVFNDILDEEFVSEVYFMGLICTLMSLTYVVEHYIKIEKSINKENYDLQLKVLKMQLNPHFMFNSLNILAELIAENPSKAEKYTIRLSKIYRYILCNMNVDLIPVAKALEFAEDYVSLLKLRYENISFRVENFKCSDNELVLPFCFQLLIENAVKHNVMPLNEKFIIRVGRRGDDLIVSNKIYEKKEECVTKDSYGVGLKNLNKRCEIFADREIVVRKDGQTYEIILPIIHKHTITHEKNTDNRR